MLKHLVFLLHAASNLFLISDAAECKPLVVSLPYKRQTLPTGADARGVSYRVGNPPQSIALLPSATYNGTYVYPRKEQGFCSPQSLVWCTVYRGGFYDSTESNSEQTGLTNKRIFDDATATWTTDKVVLKDGTDKDIGLNQIEFGVRNSTAHQFVNKGELGLGANSTFLSVLASGQKIASKTYSFFWGVDGATSDNPRDGSLILGGYDQALIGDSPNTTTKFTRNQWRCREGMIVDITGLALQSLGGGTQNIFENSEKLQACVVPTLSSVLTLPSQYWNKTRDLMDVDMSPLNGGQSNSLFYHLASIQPKSVKFTGNLSITINNEVTVIIPNEQLIFDEPGISNAGIIDRNKDWKNIPITSYTDTDQNMPRLGGMFFSAAYLMVNHDKNEFTISKAQEEPAAQNLIGIDTANGCISAVEGGSTNVPAQPNNPSPSTEKKSSKISGGAIAGIAIGVVVLICIIAGIIFLVRRRRAAAAKPHNAELDGRQQGGPAIEKYGYDTTEMPAEGIDTHARQFAELDGSSRPVEVPANTSERERLMSSQR